MDNNFNNYDNSEFTVVSGLGINNITTKKNNDNLNIPETYIVNSKDEENVSDNQEKNINESNENTNTNNIDTFMNSTENNFINNAKINANDVNLDNQIINIQNNGTLKNDNINNIDMNSPAYPNNYSNFNNNNQSNNINNTDMNIPAYSNNYNNFNNNSQNNNVNNTDMNVPAYPNDYSNFNNNNQNNNVNNIDMNIPAYPNNYNNFNNNNQNNNINNIDMNIPAYSNNYNNFNNNNNNQNNNVNNIDMNTPAYPNNYNNFNNNNQNNNVNNIDMNIPVYSNNYNNFNNNNQNNNVNNIDMNIPAYSNNYNSFNNNNQNNNVNNIDMNIPAYPNNYNNFNNNNDDNEDFKPYNLNDNYNNSNAVITDKSPITHDSFLDKRDSNNNTSLTNNTSPQKFSVLQKYAEDLTKKVYITNPAIAREEEIKNLILILLSPEKSAVLTGKAGIGKTSIVEGLAYRIEGKAVPNALLNSKIYKIATSALLGNYESDGNQESKLQLLIQEVMGQKNIILFIDEIHTLVTASRNGEVDFLNMLKPGLDRGDIKIIGATTTAEYEQFLLKDKAFLRRFEKIEVEEPNQETTVQILMGTVKKIEHATNVKWGYTNWVLELLCKFLVNMTSEYKRVYETGSRYPDVSLALLSKCFTYARFENSEYVTFKHIYQAIVNCNTVYDDVIRKELPVFKQTFKDFLEKENVEIPD